MLIIGLTGGIGSGKTTVANLFAKRGVPIIDADIIARQITQPGQPFHEIILEHFKDRLPIKECTFDRKALRQIIFNDSAAKEWLEKTLHPYIEAEIQQKLEKIVTPYCIVVIPLLAEVGTYDFIDRILVVDTTKDHQIRRVIKRDAATEEDVQSIMATQAKREERLKLAHDIIENEGTLQELENQVDRMHRFYTDMTLAQT